MFYVVIVHKNFVEQIVQQIEIDEQTRLLETNLEAATQLTENFRQNGCIDGEYWFHDIERAKAFAMISLDFVLKLAERRLEKIEQLNQQDEYYAIPPSMKCKIN